MPCAELMMPNRIRFRLTVLVSAIFLTAFVCHEYEHAPVICNLLDERVLVSATYENGHSFKELSVEPHALVYAPLEGKVIVEIEVLVGDQCLARLTGTDIELLAKSVEPAKLILWNITKDGLFPTALEDELQPISCGRDAQ